MWFSFDGQFFELWESEESARRAAQHALDEYRDSAGDGWNEEVECVCWGKLSEQVVETERRPLTEQEREECGCNFDDHVNYELLPCESPTRGLMTITRLCHDAHKNAVDKGWYGRDGNAERNIGEMLALIHSEVSEAFEDHRNSSMDQYRNGDDKPCGFPSEMADIVIRVADLCAMLGIDLEAAIADKMAYNKTRPYRHGNKLA